MRRKLTIFTCTFLFAIVITEKISIPILLSIIVLSLLLTKYIKSKISPEYLKKIIIVFLLGIVITDLNTFFFYNGELSEYINQTTEIIGQVYKVEKKNENKTNIYLCLNSGIHKEKVLLTINENVDNPYKYLYTTISANGKIQEPNLPGNPKVFNYRQYLKSQGIRFTINTTKVQVIDTTTKRINTIKKQIIQKRNLFIESLNIKEENKALLKGILFGDTNEIDESTYENFRKNATSHVLAVSGLHIGILYGIYKTIHQKIKSNILTYLFIMLLLIYGTCALWSISILRAITLVLTKIIGDMLRRRYDIVTALSLICLFQMVNNPFVIYSTSFQMSYLAVLLITFTGPKLEKYFHDYGAILGVQIFFFPYMTYVFNYYNLFGIICNIPVVYLISLVVPVGIIIFFLKLFANIQIEASVHVLDALLSLSTKVNDYFAQFEFLERQIPSAPLYIIVFFYLALFFILSEQYKIFKIRKQKKTILLILLMMFCIPYMMLASEEEFRRCDAVFIDVGQGDSLHVQNKNFDVLFDGGGAQNYNVGEKVLMQYLLKNGNAKVNAAFATHLHMDHYKGIEELASAFDVENVLKRCTKGQCIAFGNDLKVKVLWPLANNKDVDDENLNSSIFMVEIKGIKILVTGDITEEGERMLVDTYKGSKSLRADVLKISHHGSKYSTCQEFLDAVSPSIAVISVGEKNNYGHPSSQVIERLEERHIKVYRTDRDGAIGIRIKGKKIKIITNK